MSRSEQFLDEEQHLLARALRFFSAAGGETCFHLIFRVRWQDQPLSHCFFPPVLFVLFLLLGAILVVAIVAKSGVCEYVDACLVRWPLLPMDCVRYFSNVLNPKCFSAVHFG